MARVAIPVLLALLLSACTRQEVNDYSVFKYRRSDDASETALKTMGNVVPWTLEAAAFGAVAATVGGFILGWAYIVGQSQQTSDWPSRRSMP